MVTRVTLAMHCCHDKIPDDSSSMAGCVTFMIRLSRVGLLLLLLSM
jgi:hypothetical protein